MSKSTFNYESPWQGEVEIPTEIKGHEISKSRHGTVQIKDSDGRKFDYLNPEDWQNFARIDAKKKMAHYQPHRHGGLIALWFGQTGTSRLLLWANGLEDALEKCAEWLAKNAPGHITNFTATDYKNAKKEISEEKGVAVSKVTDEEAHEHLETDMTSTESGYLASDEWGDFYSPEGHPAPEKLVDVAMAIGHVVEPAEYEE